MSNNARPRLLSIAMATALAALAAGATGVEAASGRAGSNDLMFGVGSLSDDEAQIDPGFVLEQEQGNTFALKWRLHFTDFIALETDLTYESGRANFIEDGVELDSADTDTTFFMIGAVFNLTRTMVSPYVSAGFGSYGHNSSGLLFPSGQGGFVVVDIEEDGGLFTAAAGVDGRTAGPLIWLFEARYLDYSFDNFDDDWGRLLYTGYIGLSF
jgi:hypothetical protein